ncbi:hypothetical protein TNCV_3084051 [Trichonephila clavipes]|nr:hypothetical protein TNCV_3084051 [Trichonephila clavipes]
MDKPALTIDVLQVYRLERKSQKHRASVRMPKATDLVILNRGQMMKMTLKPAYSLLFHHANVRTFSPDRIKPRGGSLVTPGLDIIGHEFAARPV